MEIDRVGPDLVAAEENDIVALGRLLARDLRDRGDRDDVADLLEELIDAAEADRKKFVRLGFDLHDGPLQDVAAMGADLHLFRDQLAEIMGVADPDLAAKLVGRVDDLVARLVGLDADLREMLFEVETASIPDRPLSELLAQAAAPFAHAFAIRLELDAQLDSRELTKSQRIAVVRIAQGALLNVARHSGAANATVTVRCLPGGIELEIEDDGRGFDVQGTLGRVAETGRIGLVSMRERTRMLGGEFSLTSAPGGPTRVRVLLPPWWPRHRD